MSLDDFKVRIMDLEQRLRPIADRPVDITKHGWALRLTKLPHPLDEAGVRSEAESLLHEVIGFYQSADQEARQSIRKLFEENRAFTWAASLSSSPTTEESFRRHLLLFSLKDQERDSRDALLWLQHLCKEGGAAGVNLPPILREVAELSSDRDKHGMGSTKQMLLKAC